jgi:hypothetical protein
MRSFFILFVLVSATAMTGSAQEKLSSQVETIVPIMVAAVEEKAEKLAPLPIDLGIPRVVPVERSSKLEDEVSEVSSGQTANGYTRPDGKTRTKRYFNSMFGPFSLARSVATAGISTWRNSPEEWGPHWEGFGKRSASNIGRSVIRNSVMYGMDEALKVDSHFYRSQKKDAGSRIVNALISPVTARKPNGKRTIGIPRIAGTYTASIVAAETWYPDRYDYKDGLRNGTISLGFNAAFNLVKEFIWKK